MNVGQVYLIGAGPGSLDLLTLGAVRAIARAEVILLDDLVNPDVLQYAQAGVQLIHVGKRGGCRSTPQAFIHKKMIALARAGKIVARIKGGDPFMFGRGGEELQALRQAGIEVTIVSGITAGMAVPATLNIPLTHRACTAGVTFITGHTQGDEQPDWHALAASPISLTNAVRAVYAAASMSCRDKSRVMPQALCGRSTEGTPAVCLGVEGRAARVDGLQVRLEWLLHGTLLSARFEMHAAAWNRGARVARAYVASPQSYFSSVLRDYSGPICHLGEHRMRCDGHKENTMRTWCRLRSECNSPLPQQTRRRVLARQYVLHPRPDAVVELVVGENVEALFADRFEHLVGDIGRRQALLCQQLRRRRQLC